MNVNGVHTEKGRTAQNGCLSLRIDNGGLQKHAPGFAFSLLSWVFINQSGHTCTIYQIKAEYLSY